MTNPAHPGRMLFVNRMDPAAAELGPDAFAASMQDADTPA
jgi:hypothetical protein